MKRRGLTTALVCVVLIITSIMLSSCSIEGERFGEFGYYDAYLTAFATSSISVAEAKRIVQTNAPGVVAMGEDDTVVLSVSPGDTQDPKPSAQLVDFLIQKYAGVTIITTYYVAEEKDPVIREDYIQGTDFKAILEDNKFIPFNQLVAKNVVIMGETVDEMEAENQKFQSSDIAKIAPFKAVFTYHQNDEGQLVIRAYDFAEIPSSVGGGIGCSYRQDTEILYDSENKMVKWQTSLGVYSAMPEGTAKQGYILEIEIVWNEKT